MKWKQPWPSETVRAEFGTIAVVERHRDFEFRPASYSNQAGLLGFAAFALPPLVVAIPVVLAAVIVVANAPSAETLRRIERNRSDLIAAFERFAPRRRLRRELESRLQSLGSVPISRQVLPVKKSRWTPRYRAFAELGVDTVLEIDLLDVQCQGVIGTDVCVSVKASVRLVRTSNGRVVYRAPIHYMDSSRARWFSKWANASGAEFSAELDRAVHALVAAFVDEIFLRYEPLRSRAR